MIGPENLYNLRERKNGMRSVKYIGIAIFLVVLGVCTSGFALPNKPIPKETQTVPNQRLRLSCILPKEFPSGEKRLVRVLAIVRSDQKELNVTPVVQSETFRLVASTPKSRDMDPNRWYLFCLEFEVVRAGKSAEKKANVTGKDTSTIRFSFQKESEAQMIPIQPGIDLTLRPWEDLYRHEKKFPAIKEIPSNFFEGNTWVSTTVPRSWKRPGVFWIRTSFFVPESWRGIDWSLTIPAVDDADLTFFNGKVIGHTNGWDLFRSYRVPDEQVHYGADNEVLIAIYNHPAAGGGIKNGPIRFVPFEAAAPTATVSKQQSKQQSNTVTANRVVPQTLFPPERVAHESVRKPAGKIGNPLPLRPMTVRDGILEYIDGGEVALWGTNYIGCSVTNYGYAKKTKIDPKQMIDRDLNDIFPTPVDKTNSLDPRRFNTLRLHIYETEISDSQGNLVPNENLDLLEYMIAGCEKRGAYFWLTLMAWWNVWTGQNDSFSMNTPIFAMTLCPEVWPLEARYIKQLLTHINPYTKRRLVDEPAFPLIEIINEPRYWKYSAVIAEDDPTSTEKNRERDRRFLKMVRTRWDAQLPGRDWESPDSWNFYRYETIRQYIDFMIGVIRDCGGRQPIAYSGFEADEPITWAIADSKCDAVTTVFYSGLTQTSVSDKVSWLDRQFGNGFCEHLRSKARLVYEFDASDTLHQIDLYPAIARNWRELGVQAACQFHYDSSSTVHLNMGNSTHYLNALHTPSRFVSFLIGGQTFRTLPRGTQPSSADKNRIVSPPMAVSWKENAACFCDETLYMQARESQWNPLKIPQSPRRIIAVGSTPYYRYDGAGLVDWKVDPDNSDQASLVLFPDVIRRRDGLLGTEKDPLTSLENKERLFEMKLQSWKNAKVEQYVDGVWKQLPGTAASVRVISGQSYRLIR